MATAWVIQVEVRENSLFFFSLSLSLSPCSSLLLLLPPSLLSSSPFQRFYSSSLSFSLPLCQLSTFFFFFSPSHPLLFRFSVMLIRERITEKEWRRIDLSLSLAHTHTHTHSNTHWSGLNTERREHLTESNRLFGRCAHTHMHSTRRHSPLRLSLLSLAGSS